ncbi:nucleotidyltransferase family protein [Synechococcus sp. Nb3U1]|uniref:nucleotidyltransferase family protein n=1 Tax=Synechococcus sp. Nb3U1 TaxID=1914529 RepID=UPI00228626C0|nr:nucleotidyltransferase family protein [Synechococcus sp. Nb3U1]
MVNELNLHALILSAGFSTRMGEPKALLPWKEGQTLLSYQIAQWRQAGFQPWVVLGSHNLAAAEPHLHGAEVLINPDLEAGKTHSIRVGVEGIPADFRVLGISAVDQPRPAWIYHSLLEYHLRHRAWATVPVHRGRRGHPTLIDARLREELLHLKEETLGLRQLLQDLDKRVQEVELYTADIFLDYNTSADWEAGATERDPAH